MILCGTKKWIFYGIAVKNLLSSFIFKSVGLMCVQEANKLETNLKHTVFRWYLWIFFDSQQTLGKRS